MGTGRRDHQGMSAAIAKMAAGATVLLAVVVLGAAGYVAAGWSAADAVYMVVITVFGVGYGEIEPVDTTPLRFLTGFVIVAGYGAVIYTVGGFIQMVVDGELNEAFGARRMNKEIERTEHHTIICGYGRMGQSLADELEEAGRPFVAIDTEPIDEARTASGRLFVHGDASDEDVLRRAGIDRAAALATVLADDATNVFVTLTARAMNPTMQIVARADNRSTENKLMKCGATTVILPTEIGAKRMSQLIVRPSAETLLVDIAESGDVDLATLGLEFDELELTGTDRWTYRTLGEVQVRGAHGYLVIGIHRADGSVVMHPPPELVLDVGDRVIVLGYHDDIPELTAPTGRRPGTYRGVETEI